MPFEIDLGMPPAGYAMRAARPGETVPVKFMEFTSTEDGQHFIQRLEGLPNDILQKIPSQVKASQVDSMLAIIRRDGKATVYLNEVGQRLLVRASGPVEKGRIVTKDDIADLDRLELDVKPPDDAGVLFLFSVGWRKGLFYDFGPVRPLDSEPRKYDLSTLLGQAYCHVLFQERFSISDDEWKALFAAKWFPFAGLRHGTIDGLISHLRSGYDPDEKLADIVPELKQRVPELLDSWRKHTSFTKHSTILERALQRFQEDDFVSCTSLLFQRIEGILRTHHTSFAATNRPTPANLADAAVASKVDNEQCLLMPRRFQQYLRDVYFADFDPAAHDIDVSRHSVAHGVASASGFDQKSAAIAILMVHQLFYFLEQQRSSGHETESAHQM